MRHGERFYMQKEVTRKSIGKKKTKNVILEWSTSNFLGPMHYNKRKFDTPLVNLLKINKTGKVLDFITNEVSLLDISGRNFFNEMQRKLINERH